MAHGQTSMRKDLLTVREVAQLLNATTWTVRRYVKKDPDFPRPRKVGGRWQFYNQQIREWIRTRPIVQPEPASDSKPPD